MPKDRTLPPWITEHLPRELAESTLFRFEVELRTVVSFICNDCGTRYTSPVKKCTSIDDEEQQTLCGSKNFRREHKKVEIDLLPSLNLDYENLEEDMLDLPAQYAFYSMVYSEARLKIDVAERRLKAQKGILAERLQNTAKKEDVRLTDGRLKSIIEADETVAEADSDLAIANMQSGKLYHIMEAIKMKMELSRSLAGFKRKEQEAS